MLVVNVKDERVSKNPQYEARTNCCQRSTHDGVLIWVDCHGQAMSHIGCEAGFEFSEDILMRAVLVETPSPV